MTGRTLDEILAELEAYEQELFEIETRRNQLIAAHRDAFAAARKAVGVPSNQLAAAMGVTPAYVTNVEAARKTPSTSDSVWRYTNALRASAEGGQNGFNTEGKAQGDVQKARRKARDH